LLLLGLMLSMSSIPVAAEPIPVRVQPFAELAIYPPLSAPATVVSDNHSRITAEVTARIMDIPVRLGDTVIKSTLLVRLNQQDFELALIRAGAALGVLKAKLDLAKYQLKRARALSKKQVVSEQLLKQREAERNSLLAEQQGKQAAFAQAQQQLDKAEIRAPFNAVIVERLAQVGELARPGTPLLRIIDIDNLELAAKIQPGQARALRQASSSPETSPTFISHGQRYALTLRTITPVLDTRARTQEVRLQFSGDKPLPGATGRLVWSPSQAHLPAELISQRDGKLGVFIQVTDKTRFMALPNADTGRPAIADFPPDTAIITEGRYRLQDGDRITVQSTAQNPPPSESP